MKILEQIIVSAITVVCTSIATYIVGKRLISTQKDEVIDEILDYLASPEGQLSISNLGTIFGAGIAKGIGLKGKMRGGKVFGIPTEIVLPIVEKFMGKKTEGAISKEEQSSSSDNPLA